MDFSPPGGLGISSMGTVVGAMTPAEVMKEPAGILRAC